MCLYSLCVYVFLCVYVYVFVCVYVCVCVCVDASFTCFCESVLYVCMIVLCVIEGMCVFCGYFVCLCLSVYSLLIYIKLKGVCCVYLLACVVSIFVLK